MANDSIPQSMQIQVLKFKDACKFFAGTCFSPSPQMFPFVDDSFFNLFRCFLDKLKSCRQACHRLKLINTSCHVEPQALCRKNKMLELIQACIQWKFVTSNQLVVGCVLQSWYCKVVPLCNKTCKFINSALSGNKKMFFCRIFSRQEKYFSQSG